MPNYFVLKKSYEDDIVFLNKHFNTKIEKMLDIWSRKDVNHFWDPVTPAILAIRDQLEFFKDLSDADIKIAHVNIFVCKPNQLGGLHIDGLFSDGSFRHASINLPLSGCNDSYIRWTRTNQYPVGPVDFRNESNRAVHPGLREAEDCRNWDMIDVLHFNKPTLIKTDTWHAVDNRLNSNHRVALAFRFGPNLYFEEVYEKFYKLGLVE